MKMKLSIPEMRRLVSLTEAEQDHQLHYRLLNTLHHHEGVLAMREKAGRYRRVTRERLPEWQRA